MNSPSRQIQSVAVILAMNSLNGETYRRKAVGTVLPTPGRAKNAICGNLRNLRPTGFQEVAADFADFRRCFPLDVEDDVRLELVAARLRVVRRRLERRAGGVELGADRLRAGAADRLAVRYRAPRRERVHDVVAEQRVRRLV